MLRSDPMEIVRDTTAGCPSSEKTERIVRRVQERLGYTVESTRQEAEYHQALRTKVPH